MTANNRTLKNLPATRNTKTFFMNLLSAPRVQSSLPILCNFNLLGILRSSMWTLKKHLDQWVWERFASRYPQPQEVTISKKKLPSNLKIQTVGAIRVRNRKWTVQALSIAAKVWLVTNLVYVPHRIVLQGIYVHQPGKLRPICTLNICFHWNQSQWFFFQLNN